MALEGDRYGGGRAVPVLGHDQVRLAGSRRLPLVRVLAVQKDHNVTILLDAVVTYETVGNEVVGAFYCGVVDGLRSERLDGDDPVPVDVAAGDLAQRLGAEDRCAPQQSLPRWAAFVQRRPAVVGPDRRLELPVGQPGPDALRLDDLPDAERNGVHVRVDSPPGQRGGQLPRRLATAAVHADALAECPEAGAIGHDDVVAGLVASLLDLPDARDDAQAGQQVRDTGGEFTAGASVVRLVRRLPVPQPDTAVGRPQVTQEQADLGVVGRVHGGGKALLVRPQVLDSEFAEPGVQRLPAAVRAAERRGQIGVRPVTLGHPARRNAKLCGRRGLYEGQVLLIVGRVVDGLRADHAAVSDQVGEQ